MLNQFRQPLELILQGKPVGKVDVNRSADSWYFGQFEPAGAFSEFATLFGEWSLLMHADEDLPALSSAASDELAKLERQIDALRAELRLSDTGERLCLDQVNIDGALVEFKLMMLPPHA